MIQKIKYYRRILLGKMRLWKLKFRGKHLNVGRNFFCGQRCFVSSKNIIQIGDNFYMGNNCHLAANAVIGNDVLFASYVSVVGGDHRIDNIDVPIRLSGRDQLKTTVIKDNVWVGHGVVILHGVTICEGAVIAAGSVLTRDVEPNAIYGGNPAKLIRYRKSNT